MSSDADMAASWQETAPSVSALTALRLARMGRAAEVKFYCIKRGPPAKEQPLVSLYPQTSIRRRSRRCPVYENRLSAGRAQCTVHYTFNSDAYKHTHIHIAFKNKQNFISSLFVFMSPSPGFWQPGKGQSFTYKGASLIRGSYFVSALTLNERNGEKRPNYDVGKRFNNITLFPAFDCFQSIAAPKKNGVWLQK